MTYDSRPTVLLPGSTVEVSAVTLGTSTLGIEPGPDGLAPLRLARALFQGPYTVIDTSNNYAQSRSETALGEAIRTDGLPDSHAVVTKVDADPDTGRFDRDRVWRSFEESSSRLGLTSFPLLHLHDPYTTTVEEALAPGGAVQGLIELRDQGLVGSIGVAAGPVSLMTQYVRTGAFDAVLTHNRYTLVDRRAQELIDLATERDMMVFNAAPFGGGLLAGTGDRYAYRESPGELLAWVAQARDLCRRWSVPLPAAALHFSLRNLHIASTVVGVGRPERIDQLRELELTRIPEDFWLALEALGTPPSTLDD